MFGDTLVGIILAVIVWAVTTRLTQGYAQPSIFVWRRDRLARSIWYTVVAAAITLLPILAIEFDLLNGAPSYEFDLMPLLVLGVVWVAMMRSAAITSIEKPRAPVDW